MVLYETSIRMCISPIGSFSVKAVWCSTKLNEIQLTCLFDRQECQNSVKVSFESNNWCRNTWLYTPSAKNLVELWDKIRLT